MADRKKVKMEKKTMVPFLEGEKQHGEWLLSFSTSAIIRRKKNTRRTTEAGRETKPRVVTFARKSFNAGGRVSARDCVMWRGLSPDVCPWFHVCLPNNVVQQQHCIICAAIPKRDGDAIEATFIADLVKAACKTTLAWQMRAKETKWNARMRVFTSYPPPWLRRVRLLFNFAPPHMWCVCRAPAIIEALCTIIYFKGRHSEYTKHRDRESETDREREMQIKHCGRTHKKNPDSSKNK